MINLDALNVEELSAADRAFKRLSRNSQLTRLSILAREWGDLARALEHEAEREKIYGLLPEWAKG